MRFSAAFDAPYTAIVEFATRPRGRRRDVDDPALAALDHRRAATACARSSGACTLTSKMRRRRFSGKSSDRRVHRGRGVVDEDVDRSAEPVDGRGDDARAVVGVGEVGGDRPRRGRRAPSMRAAVSREAARRGGRAGRAVRATIATSAPSAANRARGRGADAAARAGDEHAPPGEARRVTEGPPRRSPRCSRCRRRSRLWFDGRISPCSITRSAFGQAAVGCAVRDALERGLAQRVAGPDHPGVDAVAFHVLLGTRRAATPDSGRMSTGNMCQAVSTSGVVRGSTNTSGRCAEQLASAVRSCACAPRGCRGACRAGRARTRPRAPTVRSSSRPRRR